MPDVSMFPTDNLYKFLALSGVALVILALYIREKLTHQMDRQTDKLSLAVARTEAALESAKEIGDAITGKDPDVSLLVHFIASKEAARLQHKEDGARVQILRTRLTRVQKALDRAKLLYYFGAWLAVGGFIGWYFQLQRPQDRLLQMQVQAAVDSAHVRQTK